MANKRIVVKVGTKVLVSSGGIRLDIMRGIAKQLATAYETGHCVLLVTSGAVACGKDNIPCVTRTIDKQIAATAGQVRLMEYWRHTFAESNLHITQNLCIHSDFQKKGVVRLLVRTLNLGLVPIINENDFISPEEIKALKHHGDNDMLAAIIAVAVRAAKLILLTDVDGLYEANPKLNGMLEPIPVINVINAKIRRMVQRANTDQQSGMKCKLDAADFAMRAGITTHIANGYKESISAILACEQVGTMFPGWPKR